MVSLAEHMALAEHKAALAVWDLERSAQLAVSGVEEAETVPCPMLDADRASTCRRQTTSTLGLVAISMLSDPGSISLPHHDLLPLVSLVADPLALLVAVGSVDITPM